MYTTIEADIENGQITGSEVGELPRKAHILITVLSEERPNTDKEKQTMTLRGVFSEYADGVLREKEATAWAASMEQKHDAD